MGGSVDALGGWVDVRVEGDLMYGYMDVWVD